MQSEFLITRYRVHKSIETSSIIICLARSAHLEIIRQRERNLNYDVSLKSFWKNINSIILPSHKITSIVQTTGIPKETVRRKIKKLINTEHVKNNKYREYFWNLTSKRKENFINMVNNDIKALSKYLLGITNLLNLKLTQEIIEAELKSDFSFYFYHFYNCQLVWLKMWQKNLKDIDLIFIAIQALIPTLNYIDKNNIEKKLMLDDLHKVIGKVSPKIKSPNNTISASSIAEVSGIPRATCIRKLEKLVKLGLLVREVKSKRYYVNQFANDRTKTILKKENVNNTVAIFSEYLALVVNALVRYKK
tara:strand:+ start:1602 stop:2516 length:915 start_codon:yes stop_codon:yes gene_type:complete